MELPAIAGITHRRVPVNGTELHLACAGEGRPLLLLHGWPQHWWSWRKVIGELAARHRVIAPDLRGWGWSEAPPGDYAKAVFAADLLALLDAEGIDRVSIIAHDWGAYAAFLLALAHPRRIERMVTLDIPPPWPEPLRPRHLGTPLLLTYQLPLALPGVGARILTSGPAFVRAVIRAGSGPGMRWTEDELDAYAVPLREPARAAASSACYRTFLTRELPAVIAGRGPRPDQLRVPTLLLMGSHSPLQRALAPRAAPQLSVEQVAGAGHFIPEEAPGELLARALPFLAAAG
ncbi:MAG: alpha/beta fold hydrolase [Solirubrobacterales bacterium]|nr:alpha/beta fold hydrolase [Solirubrobacterales bacterium]